MKTLLAVLLLTAMIAPSADPHLTARWDSATSSTVQWYQTARGCLYRVPVGSPPIFIQCHERYPATIIATFGHVGPLSGDLRPMPGDSYLLQTGGKEYRAPLIGRAVYLAVWRG